MDTVLTCPVVQAASYDAASKHSSSSECVAQVVCRQLGFAFGGLMNPDPAGPADDNSAETQAAPVAANFVRCSGLEARMSDCTFQEDRRQAFLALDELEGSLEMPVQGPCASDATATLAVVYRQFPVTG